MQWIFLLIVSALGYSMSRFIRNFLIDTTFTKAPAGTMFAVTIWNNLTLALLTFIVFRLQLFQIEPLFIVCLLGGGMLQILSELPHFKALAKADTIEVTIFSQINPILSLIFSFLILGQQIAMRQLIGFGFIIAAAALLVFGGRGKRKIEFAVAGYALTSSILWVLSDIVFIYFSNRVGVENLTLFASSFFFFELGAALTALILLVINKSWRRAYGKSLRRKGNKIRLITLINTVFYATGEMFFKFAIISAPILALLAAVDQVMQVTITFLLGVILSYFFPKFGRESLTRQIITRYVSAIALVIIGIVISL